MTLAARRLQQCDLRDAQQAWLRRKDCYGSQQAGARARHVIRDAPGADSSRFYALSPQWHGEQRCPQIGCIASSAPGVALAQLSVVVATPTVTTTSIGRSD